MTEYYVSIAERREMSRATEELKELIDNKITVAEVANHLDDESLWNFCGAFREEAKGLMYDMAKEKQGINDFANEVHDNAVAHGWWEEKRPFGEIIALCHSELSEALEAYRNREDMVWMNGDKPDGIAVEMCDCIIRILDYLAEEEVDIEYVLKLKHEYNKSREYKHGGKVI